MKPNQRVELLRGHKDRMRTMPNSGVVVSTDPRKGEMKFGGAQYGSSVPVSSPYLGPSSWIRVMPERATKVMISYRAENLQPYVSAYVTESIDANDTTSLIEATESGKFYFRVLKEGEIQMTSIGLADVSALANGNLEMRGGAVSLTLDNVNLEARTEAPVHRRATLDSPLLGIGDEERFGVITRPSPLDPTVNVAVSTQSAHAKERLVTLTHEALRVPLVDVREGFVVENNGVFAISNGNKIRHRSRYGTTAGTFVELTVDETGNTTWTIPQSQKGLTVITQNADTTFQIGKKWNVSVSESAGLNIRTKMRVDAQAIELAGTNKLIQQTWQNTWNQAVATLVPPASVPNPGTNAASITSIIAALNVISNALTANSTRTVSAG